MMFLMLTREMGSTALVWTVMALRPYTVPWKSVTWFIIWNVNTQTPSWYPYPIFGFLWKVPRFKIQFLPHKAQFVTKRSRLWTFREVIVFALKIVLIIILLWRFGPFSGHGLPVAGVSRQESYCEPRTSAPRPTPDLEGQGICLRPASVAVSAASCCRHGL
jgi:hypothetical protein